MLESLGDLLEDRHVDQSLWIGGVRGLGCCLGLLDAGFSSSLDKAPSRKMRNVTGSGSIPPGDREEINLFFARVAKATNASKGMERAAAI